MNHFYLVFLSLLCVACASVRQVTPQENTRIEVRTETVVEKDTLFITLPQIVERIQTLDTLSVLENKYAKSEASVSNGVLSHSLATKPVNEPVEVEKQIVYRDSLVYVDKIMTETVEIEKPLSSGDRFFLTLGKWLFTILILYGFWRLFKLLYLNKLK